MRGWWCVWAVAWWCAGGGGGGALALQCWRCGQYSDGVGSITPCINASAATLAHCAHSQKECIKYVSELTTVRDCVPSCTEKEWWGARTYCCDTDGCNFAPPAHRPPSPLLLLAGVLGLRLLTSFRRLWSPSIH